MRNQPKAIVIGSSIGALSIVRSLGRRSVEVILLTSDFSEYATKSRYCHKVKCENLYGNALVEKLKKIANSWNQKVVLFCTSDLSVLTIAEHRKELEEFYHFVLPSDDIVKMLMSKQQFHEFATTNEFRVPRTFFINCKEDIEKVGHLTSYPCVVKPEFRDNKWVQKVSKLDKILLVRNKEEYTKYFDCYDLTDNKLIVQEWIDGSDADVYYCLTYINRDHQPLAIFTGRKIRQFPLLTGSTSLAESKKVPFLAEESIRLLRTASCIGLCSVEFKFSKKDNTFLITEPTIGRVDTQEGSSISSGMDIPFIAYLDAQGLKPAPLKSFQEGVRWINESEDYSSVRNYLKNKNINLKELINSYKGKRSYALKAIDDPLPLISFFYNLLKRGFRKFSHFQN